MNEINNCPVHIHKVTEEEGSNKERCNGMKCPVDVKTNQKEHVEEFSDNLSYAKYKKT